MPLIAMEIELKETLEENEVNYRNDLIAVKEKMHSGNRSVRKKKVDKSRESEVKEEDDEMMNKALQ